MNTIKVIIIIVLLNLVTGLVLESYNWSVSENDDVLTYHVIYGRNFTLDSTSEHNIETGGDTSENYNPTIGSSKGWTKNVWGILSSGFNPYALSKDNFKNEFVKIIVDILFYFRWMVNLTAIVLMIMLFFNKKSD